ncbi:hypothetical protein V2O64_12595 [Verrucomicrobiaceae bacterium 227]
MRLLARGEGVEDLEFRIVLGHPFQKDDSPDFFAVRVELDGLETAGTPIYGVDEIQAMVLAIRFMLSRLGDIAAKRKLRFFWADDPSEEFDPGEYFNTIPSGCPLKVKGWAERNGKEKVTMGTVQLIAFGLFLACMLMGIFAAGGVCAMIFGSEVLDTSLGGEGDWSDPALIIFLCLMIPGMVVGAIGGIFGIVLPLYGKFGIPMDRSDEGSRRMLRKYASWLLEYTKPRRR